MRIAIVSDVHGNLTALEAVIADVRQAAPDLVLHGGDLADGGSSPCEVVDRIRALGWRCVAGNGEEMLTDPGSLASFAARSPDRLQPLFAAVAEMAAATRAQLGDQRLAWLRTLPSFLIRPPLALVHATPESLWRGPPHDAADAELQSEFGPLDQPVAVYSHIHRPFVRTVPGMSSPQLIVANSGSVGMPYDGDRRAAWLLLDGLKATIHRVEYDIDREVKALAVCGFPHANWTARMLRSARFEMP